MNKEQMNQLMMEIYTLISTSRDEKKKEIYERVLCLINEARDMRHTLKTISRIGSQHCT